MSKVAQQAERVRVGERRPLMVTICYPYLIERGTLMHSGIFALKKGGAQHPPEPLNWGSRCLLLSLVGAVSLVYFLFIAKGNLPADRKSKLTLVIITS